MQEKWTGVQYMEDEQIFFAIKNTYLMKILFISFLFCISISYCKEENVNETMVNKIEYYENYGSVIFNKYQITEMRDHGGIFKVSRLDSIKDYAIINIHSDSKIEKNFTTDTINSYFLNTFKKINCYYLIADGNFVRIDFRFQQNNFLLYKGYPSKSIYLQIDTSKSIPINELWSFVKFSRNHN